MTVAQYLLNRAQHRASIWLVFFMTICESIFLFIPPEVFMTPPIVADRRRALPVTLAAIAGSFIGGILAYCIGLWLFDSVGIWLISHVASMEKFALAQELFLRHGALIIILTAVTPIPYKIMAICAGFLGFPLWLFILLSSIFRTVRFAIVGWLLWRFQEYANAIVKKYFWPLTIGALVCTGIGVCILTMV